MRYSNKQFGGASDMRSRLSPPVRQMYRLSEIWNKQGFVTKMRGTASAAPQTNAADALPQIDGFHLLRLTEITGPDFLSDLRFLDKISVNPVKTEAPGVMFIITHSSIRRTIPVAFIIKLPVSVVSYPFRKERTAHFRENFAVRRQKGHFIAPF